MNLTLKIANENMSDNKGQYIISANEDQLQSIRQYFTDDEYANIVEKNVVLYLTDGSDSTKLLGVQVDLDYENE